MPAVRLRNVARREVHVDVAVSLAPSIDVAEQCRCFTSRANRANFVDSGNDEKPV